MDKNTLNHNDIKTPEATTVSFPGLLPAVAPAEEGAPVVIAGPCSAESRTQVLEVAAELAAQGIRYFRAGVWKPRTMPGGFEGRGAVALEWLAEVQRLYPLEAATEVANAAHVRLALDAGIHILWIGARTAANPFAVQEVADAIAQWRRENPQQADSLAVMVKNPVNPDLALWTGAIQRIYNAGVRRLAAIHRGFSAYGLKTYRNTPLWHIPIELRRRFPRLQLLCDPSHIGGRRELIGQLSQEALDLRFDGIMVESHCSPDEALSDARQQITPAELRHVLDALVTRRSDVASDELMRLRSLIDQLDDRLVELLSRRMQLSREIGALKREHDMSVVQPLRYEHLMTTRLEQAAAAGLSPEFMRTILATIHEESVAQQTRLPQ